MLGSLHAVACAGGMALLALFYLSAIPLDGLPGPRLEGAYLIVNKNLIELAALAAVHAFRTGRIAGLDRWFASSRTAAAGAIDGSGSMTITPEKAAEGRRNFLKILAGTPALAALGVTAAMKGPVRGGPVRVGFVGVGGQGRVLLSNVDPAFAEVRALCDINPASLKRADEVLARNKVAPARHYADWHEMLQKEDIEAVIMAPPLWAHADLAIGMSRSRQARAVRKDDGRRRGRLRADARHRAPAGKRVLEIGYQRNYNAMYQAAYDGLIKTGALGDIYHVRLAWHRNGNWRRKGEPPSPISMPRSGAIRRSSICSTGACTGSIRKD